MTAFHNRIRLPINLSQPQFPETREIYRKTDGSQVVQSIVIRKVYEGATDWLSERLHERLKIALGHDTVQFEADNYLGLITQAADYQIAWNKFRQYPIAPASFQAEVTPFDATNSNCQTCEDATQIKTNDDSFYPDLNENTDYSLNVIANDEICCFPSTYSITSFNSTYLTTATIDTSGVIHIHTKTGLTDANLINLLTYRVTCPNGNYDESDVFANINGSIAGCLAPSVISFSALTPTSIEIDYTPPSPLPDHYSWYLYNNDTNVVDQSNDQATGFNFNLLTGLLPGTDYIFYMRSECDPTNGVNSSNYISVPFTTPNQSLLCGEYTLTLNDPSLPSPGAGGHLNVGYIDCNGNNQTLYLSNFGTKAICAMQTGPGAPTFINTGGNPHVTITYRGVCGGVPTLTFSYTNAGGFQQFVAILSAAIDAPININRVFADGFATSGCAGGAVSSSQKNSVQTISTGGTGVTSAPDIQSGVWASAHFYSMYNVNVNGIPVVDGSLLTIGSFQVLMVIPFCN